MTSLLTSPLLPVLTPAGNRIPLRGTIACHPSLGMGEVVTRSGSRLRIAITSPEEGVAARLAAVSAARSAGAEIEIAGLEARMADKMDPLNGAKALVDGMIEGLIAGCTEDNEVLVNIDDAEAFGWEFDEFCIAAPKKTKTRGKAPAPRAPKQEPSNVGTLEDAARPDWLVAELNETFGNDWTPNSRA